MRRTNLFFSSLLENLEMMKSLTESFNVKSIAPANQNMALKCLGKFGTIMEQMKTDQNQIVAKEIKVTGEKLMEKLMEANKNCHIFGGEIKTLENLTAGLSAPSDISPKK